MGDLKIVRGARAPVSVSLENLEITTLKKTILAALILGASFRAFAQTFTAQQGYTAASLFNTGPGFAISGLGADLSGNLFYIESGNFGGTSDTRLFERKAADNFASEISLFSYGAAGVSGSFVRVLGSRVYFGENSAGTIRSVNFDGSAPALIATVANNYDLAFSGTAALLSANPAGFAAPDNKVYGLNLTNGQLDTLLDTGGDYSGPIAIDSAGNLLYGATNFGAVTGGLFEFLANKVNGVRDPNPQQNDTTLTLADGVRIQNNGNNGYLGLQDDRHLFALDSPFGSPGIVKRFDLTNTAIADTVGLTGTGEFFGAAGATASGLYVAVSSSFSNGPSTVYRVAAVPEPAAGALFAAAALLGGFAFFRRK
ncbi:MAG: hypothetical protein QOD99_2826 [Chthoniobacter sp.]|jgi:hypothetical protein|nr:hypothetical protein [Chthoniobacter sp.]